MASLVTEANGYRRLEFERPAPYKGRGRIRLGKMPKCEAESIKGQIEQLLQDLYLGRSHDRVLCEWIKSRPSWLRDRMAKEHLAEASQQTAATLGEFLVE